MIHHIARIVNTSKDHDMAYGFLRTSVFEQSGITLQKRVSLQNTDEVGSSTLLGCGFPVTKSGNTGFEQGFQTPFHPVLKEPSSSSTPTLNTLIQDKLSLQGEIAEVKKPVAEELKLNAQRHAALMLAISALTSKSSPPSI